MIIRTPEDKHLYCKFVQSLDLSKPWDMSAKVYVKKRTVAQNSIYWKWNGILGQHVGETSKGIHIALMDELLPQKFEVVMGKERPVPKTTTTLNVIEFMEYLNHIYRFAASFHGVILPIPEEMALNT